MSLIWLSTVATNAAELAGSEWGVSKPLEQFVQFSGNRKVSGHAGCNRFFGSFVLEKSNGSITIGPLASTKKACPKPILNAERKFLNKLETAKFYKRSQKYLELFDKNSESLLRLNWHDFD